MPIALEIVEKRQPDIANTDHFMLQHDAQNMHETMLKNEPHVLRQHSDSAGLLAMRNGAVHCFAAL